MSSAPVLSQADHRERDHSAPKKVVFVTSDFPIGGSESMTAALLNRLDRSKISPVLVSLGPPGGSEKKLAPDIRLVRFARKAKFDFAPAEHLAEFLRQERAEVVVAIGFFCYLFVKLAQRHLAEKLPEFIVMHSTKPKSVKVFLLDLLYARMLSPSARLITTCKSQMHYLSSLYRIPLDRFRYIYNGVDPHHWTIAPVEFDREAFRTSLGIPREARVIVQVAMLRKEKRQEDSLSALASLREKGAVLPYLLLIGTGPADRVAMLKAMAQRLGIDDHVRFCGQVDDVRPFYWSADLCTLSSISETFSMAVLEAMATGLPCVVTDLGGAREIIENAADGLCVPPGRPGSLGKGWMQVLNAVDGRGAERRRLKILQKFTLELCVEAYEQTLLGVAAAPPEGRTERLRVDARSGGSKE